MKQNKAKEIEQLRAMDRALLREQALEGGWYSRPKHQVHKSKKAYSRKDKHPSRYDVN
jgi:hypothetical protein